LGGEVVVVRILRSGPAGLERVPPDQEPLVLQGAEERNPFLRHPGQLEPAAAESGSNPAVGGVAGFEGDDALVGGLDRGLAEREIGRAEGEVAGRGRARSAGGAGPVGRTGEGDLSEDARRGAGARGGARRTGGWRRAAT